MAQEKQDVSKSVEDINRFAAMIDDDSAREHIMGDFKILAASLLGPGAKLTKDELGFVLNVDGMLKEALGASDGVRRNSQIHAIICEAKRCPNSTLGAAAAVCAAVYARPEGGYAGNQQLEGEAISFSAESMVKHTDVFAFTKVALLVSKHVGELYDLKDALKEIVKALGSNGQVVLFQRDNGIVIQSCYEEAGRPSGGRNPSNNGQSSPKGGPA